MLRAGGTPLARLGRSAMVTVLARRGAGKDRAHRSGPAGKGRATSPPQPRPLISGVRRPSRCQEDKPDHLTFPLQVVTRQVGGHCQTARLNTDIVPRSVFPLPLGHRHVTLPAMTISVPPNLNSQFSPSGEHSLAGWKNLHTNHAPWIGRQ